MIGLALIPLVVLNFIMYLNSGNLFSLWVSGFIAGLIVRTIIFIEG